MNRRDLLHLKKFGSIVRVMRGDIGITQMDLAERAGCSLQAIGNIERGRANPSLLMIYRIANALGVSAKDLVT